jgi:hypothetical protein
MKSRSSSGGARRFGLLALTATVLAMGAIAPAMAAAAAPENNSRPTISVYSHPHVGSELFASPGVWTGSPTFTYQWERCLYNGFGACSTIAGATTSIYIPTTADITKTLRVKVTGTNGEGSTLAYSNETFPLTARLAVCRNVLSGNGTFEDSSCLQEGGSKQYKWVWTSAESLRPSGGITHIRWQSSGLAYGVVCTDSSGIGDVGDNKGGMLVKNLQMTLSGCTVSAPAGHGCKVADGKIYLNPIEGSAIELGSNPRIELKPSEGKLGQITFEGCTPAFLNVSYPMESASFYATMGAQNAFDLEQKTLVMMGWEAKWESFAFLKDSSGALAAFRP